MIQEIILRLLENDFKSVVRNVRLKGWNTIRNAVFNNLIFSLFLWEAILSIPEVQQQQIQMKRNRLQKCQNKLPESKTMAIRLFFGFEKKSITEFFIRQTPENNSLRQNLLTNISLF